MFGYFHQYQTLQEAVTLSTQRHVYLKGVRGKRATLEAVGTLAVVSVLF